MQTTQLAEHSDRTVHQRVEAMLVMMYQLELQSGRQVVPIVNSQGQLVSFYSVVREDWLPQ
jgi:hypothetical protein